MSKFKFFINFFCLALVVGLTSCDLANIIDEGKNMQSDNNNTGDYILNPNVVVIGEEWDSHISGIVTGDTITLSSSQGLTLPNVGEILLKPKVTEKFPYGFLGKVIEVSQSEIITEDVALEEAFKKLTININSLDISKEIQTAINGENNSISSVQTMSSSSLRSDILSKTVKFPLQEEFKYKNFTAKATGSIEKSFIISYYHDIVDSKTTKTEVSLKSEDASNISFDALLEGKYSDSILIIPELDIPITSSPIPLTLSLKVFIYLNVSGQISFKAEIENKTSTTFGFSYENLFSDLHPIYESSSSKEFDGKFNIDGKFGLGPGVELRIKPFNKDYVSAFVKGKALFSMEAKFECDEAKDDTWEKFQGTEGKLSLIAEGSVGVEAKWAKLWKVSAKISIGSELPLREELLLPNISDLQVTNGGTTDEKQISYRLSNDVLFAGRYGMILYDSDGNIIDIKYNNEYSAYISELKTSTPTFTFNGLASKKTYTAFPVFNLFGLEIVDKNESKKITDTNLDENGLTGSINEIVPPDILQKLEVLGIPINGGNTPPNIEGTYLATPLELVKNMTAGDITEQWDMYITFGNQNNSTLTIDADYTMSYEGAWWSTETMTSKGPGSFIVGQGNKFTVFVDARRTASNTSVTAKTVEIFSGEIAPEGIYNFQWAVIMVDDAGDPDNVWIENGGCYMKKDGDGFSPRVTSNKSIENKSLSQKKSHYATNDNKILKM